LPGRVQTPQSSENMREAIEIMNDKFVGLKPIIYKSLMQNERRSEIERKIFCARMSCETARKRSSAPLRTISPGKRRTGYF